jgi:hypothetical protein
MPQNAVKMPFNDTVRNKRNRFKVQMFSLKFEAWIPYGEYGFDKIKK